MEKTSWHIIPWKKHGMSYQFSDEKEARAKYKELSALLKSDEKLQVLEEKSEITEYEWKP